MRYACLAIGGLALLLISPSFSRASELGPTVTVQSSISSPTNIASIPLSIAFSSNVEGFSVDDIQITGPANIDPASFSGSGSSYTATLSISTGGEIQVVIPADVATDSNTNGNKSGSFTIMYDKTRPHLALSPDPIPTQVDAPFEVTMNSTNPLVAFTADDVSIVGGTVSDVHPTRSGNRNFAFTVTPTGGPLHIYVPDHVLVSTAGNLNVESNHLYSRMGPVTASGVVWRDQNGNGIKEAADVAIASVTISATPILEGGAPDTNRTAFSAQSDTNGVYTLTFAPSTYGYWRITPQLTADMLLTSGTTTLFNANNESIDPDLGFGIAYTVEAGDGVLIPLNGTAESAEGFITPEGAALEIEGDGGGMIAGTSTVRIPPNTTIRKTDGSTMSLVDVIRLNTGSNPEGNRVYFGSLRWGSPGVGLTYSQPVSYSLHVGEVAGGLQIEQRSSTDSDWMPIGFCTIAAKTCSFQTTSSPLNPLSPIQVSGSPSAPVVSSANIRTNNTVTTVGKVNHTVILTFSADRAVQLPLVTIANEPRPVSLISASTRTYRSTFVLTATTTEGVVPFTISLTGTDGTTSALVTATTDGTTVTFDKTVPQWFSVTPTATTTTVTQDPTVSFSTSEANISFQCKVNTGLYAPCTSPWNPTLPIGTNTVYIRANDQAGNAIIIPRTIRKETLTPPTLTSANIVSSNPSSSFARTGNNIFVYFSADRAVQLPVVTIAGRTASVSLTSSATNSYRALIRADATDPEGPVAFSISLTSAVGVPAASAFTSTTDGSSVTMDRTIPVITISSPTSTTSVVSGNPTLSFNAGEAGVSFMCRVGTSTYQACTSPWTPTIPVGKSTLYIYAVDRAGNVGPVAHRIITKESDTPPSLSMVSMNSNNATSSLARVGNFVYVYFTPTKNIQPPLVTIAGRIASTSGPNSQGRYTAWTRVLSSDTEGPVPFSISFTSIAGVVGSGVSATTNNIKTVIDKTAPVAYVETPITVASVAAASSPTFLFSANDPAASFLCYINSGSYFPCTSPWSPSLTTGAHTLIIRAVDPAGNVGPAVVKKVTKQ